MEASGRTGGAGGTPQTILGSILDMLTWRWLYRSEAQEADLSHRSGFVGHSQEIVMKCELNPNILRMTENGQRSKEGNQEGLLS